MLPRKRRIKDQFGDWVDPKELEGRTITHEIRKDPKTAKPKVKKIQYDPFKLVPCQNFSEEHKAPYSVRVVNTCLAVMDLHSHISKTEVIGLVGGQFNQHQACLTISMAVPCRSMSTGMQCEMDPVSQTLASEKICEAGLSVVGWYHSHPTFRPDPSVRDIETQLKLQEWFSKGGNHFVGVIISPYNLGSPSVSSSVQCLTVSQYHSLEFAANIPFKFAYDIVYERSVFDEVVQAARELSSEYCSYFNRVRLTVSQFVGMSCLNKMLQSVKHKLVQQKTKIEEKSASLTMLERSQETSLADLRPHSTSSMLGHSSNLDDPLNKDSEISELLQILEQMFTEKFV